jgi:Acyl-CoA carboxylase epsilon subunit
MNVTRGNPTEIELAALVAALLSLLTRGPAAPVCPRPAPWTRDRHPAPGSWRAAEREATVVLGYD